MYNTECFTGHSSTSFISKIYFQVILGFQLVQYFQDFLNMKISPAEILSFYNKHIFPNFPVLPLFNIKEVYKWLETPYVLTSRIWITSQLLEQALELMQILPIYSIVSGNFRTICLG